ncbi:hypothetical protein [Plebeiibacterium marinum]|uniref:Glycine zipper family protein n=1 Tax=Plebeiibacterium marinum TaxID=2992111 RepID=A0AAE3MA98_9BACT|nr:hypothetical protein [Plebeiobacterium marinum]MCW3804000.1 hypothetical protein [Plebeiobacterium marinum]
MAEVMGYEEWIQSLEEKAERLPKVQAALSNFQVLPRLGKLLESKSSACPDCLMYWGKLQEATLHLDQFFEDGNSYSLEFDNQVEKIMKHLKVQHSIKPKGLVLSVNALKGMALGVVFGIVVSFLIPVFPMKGGIILGWVLGTLGGWFFGKYKEERLRKSDLLF